MKSLLLNSLKVAGAGASIVALAWCFVTFGSPSGAVPPVEATIFDMGMFSPPTKQQAFMQVLKDFDMEHPRSYNWNGNTVLFSMGSVDESPKQFMHLFQQALVARGVNKKAHHDIIPAAEGSEDLRVAGAKPTLGQQKKLMASGQEPMAYLDDFFAGGLVPTTISDNLVAMAGNDSRAQASDALGFLQEQFLSRRSLSQTVGRMRYVEARREPGDLKTTISAVWSDDKLELDKFLPDAKRSDLAVSPGVPACLGCRRLMNFRGEGHERDYGTHIFVGRQSVAETLAFYDRAMLARGWRMTGATRAMRALDARGLAPPQGAQLASFTKDGKFITVLAHPLDNGAQTQVHIFDSP